MVGGISIANMFRFGHGRGLGNKGGQGREGHRGHPFGGRVS